MDIDINQIAQRRREMVRPVEPPAKVEQLQPVDYDAPVRDELEEQIDLIRWVAGD